MKELFTAEIYVETVFSMESGAENGTWFVPANYATMAEFLTDCASWFDEDDPEYLYLEWTDVPDYLIRRDWLCPNIFEIRDALQMLDESDIEQFAEWCRDNGHDLRTDDASMLITRFQDSIRPVYESDPDADEDDYIELPRGLTEVFDNDYN